MPSTETPHLDLLFAGSVFCDLVFAGVPTPQPGAEVYAEAFKLTPGGVANRAVAGSRLGARTALLSQLGDDPLGLHIAGHSWRRSPTSTSAGCAARRGSRARSRSR